MFPSGISSFKFYSNEAIKCIPLCPNDVTEIAFVNCVIKGNA